MAAALPPTPEELSTRLGSIEGATVRPFADGTGAVIVARRRVVFVELDGRMSERTADWLNRLDSALDGPIATEVVHNAGDLERLAEAMGTEPGR